MTGGILGFLGGIGLFVFGIETMTAALRSLAGEGLRRWLLRVTSTPLRGVLTGAGITAVVQSSTAVMVMVIGFVGAGVISFAQSLGVIYGANIGTTVTGWIVLVAGVRFQLGTVALPLVLIGALMGIFGEGRIGRAGRMLAGFALMFVGLDMMQAAAAGWEGRLTPDILPGESPAGLLALVLIGLVLVAVIQSSSAAIALMLVLMGSGSLSLAQAAALVIGINIGATLTEFLASLVGGRETLRAVLANLLFNLGTAVVVFPLLLVLAPPGGGAPAGPGGQWALAAFHTGFNLTGVILFLPLTARLAALVERLVPARPVTLAAGLDPPLLSDPGTALDAAARTASAIADEIGRALQAALAPGDRRDLRPLDGLADRVDPARAALVTWLARIHLAPDQAAAMDRRGHSCTWSIIWHG
jgi:phosphate:Na+ symporter